MTGQVIVPFTIWGYTYEVVCDVVPMNASHLFLGRSWQFDREVMHNGRTYNYFVSKDKKRVLFTPLSLTQAMRDQLAISKVTKESLFANKGEVKRALHASEFIYY